MLLGLRGMDGVQGGVETHVTQLVRHLPISTERIEVFGRSAYRHSDVPSDPSLPITRWLPTVGHPALEALVHSLLAVGYAAIRRPALLHIHGIGPNIVTPLARLLGLRVVATHHGADYDREKWGRFARWMLKWGERRAVLNSNACICISPVTADALRVQYHRDVIYIPNGVEPMVRVPPGPALAKFGLESGRYVVNVGRLVPEKRQIDLIEAFSAANLPSDVRLLLIGGAYHEGDYDQRLRLRAATEPRVILAGHVSGEPLAELFCNAGLFALPSAHEGLPIALLEAMAYGLPLLLSDLPVYPAMGLPDSCLFPVGDIGEIARRLTTFFAAPPDPVDWRATLASYNWNQVALETAQVYNNALGYNDNAPPPEY